MERLLKQAREALEDSMRVLTVNGCDTSWTRPALEALRAYDSLSEYDKAVEALAPYLPDGWVAQDADGRFDHYKEKPYFDVGSPYWRPKMGRKAESTCLALPTHETHWLDSLRCITRTHDGVSVTKG